MNKSFATVCTLGACLVVSACVSDTLSQQDTGQQSLASSSNNPNFDPAQRERALIEMRAKADQVATPELTNAYADGDGPTSPMTPAEQSAGISELEQAARKNAEAVSDPELEDKQRSIRQMQVEGRRHYNDAVKNIQN